jgi:hypothetical protein
MKYTDFHIPEHFKHLKTVVHGDFETTLQVSDSQKNKNLFIRSILFPDVVSKTLAKQLRKDFAIIKKLNFPCCPTFHDLTIKKNSIVYSFDEFEGEPLVNMLPLAPERTSKIFANLIWTVVSAFLMDIFVNMLDQQRRILSTIYVGQHKDLLIIIGQILRIILMSYEGATFRYYGVKIGSS